MPTAGPRWSTPRGQLLGVFDRATYSVASASTFTPDSTLVLYTDGLLEASAPEQELTPEDLAANLAGGQSADPQELVDRLYDRAVSGREQAPRDDIAILAVRLLGGRVAPGSARVRPLDSATCGLPGTCAPRGSTYSPRSVTTARCHHSRSRAAHRAAVRRDPRARRPSRVDDPVPNATVQAGSTLRSIPNSFLGLSIEFEELARYERLPAFPTFLSQLETPGTGPLSLRVGGESADNTYLSASQKLPGWSYLLTPTWFAQLSNLITSVHLRVIIDLNLAVRSTAQASQMARDTVGSAPRGFDPGVRGRKRTGSVPVRRRRDPQGPVQEPGPVRLGVRLHAAVIRVGIQRLCGCGALERPRRPARRSRLGGSQHDVVEWDPTGRGKLAVVSVHRYPFAACGPPKTPQYPTSAGFLSAGASTGLAQSVARRSRSPIAATCRCVSPSSARHRAPATPARRIRSPRRCGRRMRCSACSRRASTASTSHSRWKTPNTPLNGVPVLQARPLFYGLVTFARMLGPGARLLRTTVHSPSALALSAWVVQAQDGSTRALLINKSRNRLTVGVGLPTRSAAISQALRAPAATATSGLTLGGQTLGSDGRWHGTASVVSVPRSSSGQYVTRVPGYSAVLLAAR